MRDNGTPGREPGRRALRLVLLAGLLVAAAGRADAGVLVLRGGDAPLHREAVTGLRAALPPGLDVSVHGLGSGTGTPAPAQAVIAVGTDALDRALADHPAHPVLALLVPRRTAATLVAAHSGRQAPFAALYLDQPAERQQRLARALFPSLERFGLVLAADSDPAEFATAGAALAGVALERTRPGEPPLRAVARLASRVDAIIGVPDARIYGPRTIHGILLASYRANVPLVGYSRAVVRAGGLASAWLPPRAHGTEAARMIAPYLAGERGGWPASRYSRRFRIAINEQVAHSLGLRPAVDVAGREFRAGEAIE